MVSGAFLKMVHKPRFGVFIKYNHLFVYLWIFTQDSLFNYNQLLSARVLFLLQNIYTEAYRISSD